MRLSLEQDAADALLLVSAEVVSDSTTKDAHLSPHNDKQQLDIFPEVEILDNVQRVVNLAQGQESFPGEGVKLKDHLLEIERGLIKQALDKANGNVSQTARLLGLQRTTLIEKINKHNLNDTY